MNEANMHAGMGQKMAASASMQMGVRILQANVSELNQIVRKELERNPVLELENLEGGKESETDVFSETGLPIEPDGFGEGDGGYSDNASGKYDFLLNSLTENESLFSHLEKQAIENATSEDVLGALKILIASLDDRGFFEEPPEEIAQRHVFSEGVFRQALNILRGMEPNGVGARDLRDSLLIQLKNQGETEGDAVALLTHGWNEVIKHQYELAAKKANLSLEAVSLGLARIARLNPDPGVQFRNEFNPDVSPDVLVEEDGAGVLSVYLCNYHIPQIKLSGYYKEQLAENFDNKELVSYLKHSFKSGRELIRAIAQRQKTVLDVAKSIVNHQHGYFKQGTRYMEPLLMVDVADELGINVSTVSRAVAGKYLKSKWGLKELRSFFSSSLSFKGEALVSEVSSISVHERIRQVIELEDKKRPLSDAAITNFLEQQGLDIARRTVAKYREQMKILPAKMRRRI